MDTSCVCAVCTMPFLEEDGSPSLDEHGAVIQHVVCTKGHAVCHPCLASFLDSQAQAPDKTMLEHWKASKMIHCAMLHSCQGHIERKDILGLSADVSGKCLDLCCRLAERETFEETAKNKSSDASAPVPTQVAEHLLSKVKDLMTMSCPHCGTSFNDFDGCMLLHCANPACQKPFCGLCCKTHRGNFSDPHEMVSQCASALPVEVRQQYRIDGFFMHSDSWPAWKERLQVERIIGYLQTLRYDIVWDSFARIQDDLLKGKLMSREGVERMRAAVFSHSLGSLFLVRIPNVFWLIYSSRRDITFEEACQRRPLSPDERKEVGLRIVQAIRVKYPSWRDIKCRVPGEHFDAINYPPELLPLIATEIDKWGTAHGVWTEGDYDESAFYAPPPQFQAPFVVPPAQARPQLAPMQQMQQQQQQVPVANNNNVMRQQPHQQPRPQKRPHVAPPANADNFAGMEDVAGLMRGLQINRRR